MQDSTHPKTTMHLHLHLQALYQRFYSLLTESPPLLPFVPIRVVVRLSQTVPISGNKRLTALAPLTIDNHGAFSPNTGLSSHYILYTLPSKFNDIRPNKARRKTHFGELIHFRLSKKFQIYIEHYSKCQINHYKLHRLQTPQTTLQTPQTVWRAYTCDKPNHLFLSI